MSAKLVAVIEFVQSLIDQEKTECQSVQQDTASKKNKPGRKTKTGFSDAALLALEVKRAQRYIKINLSADMSKKAAIILLKLISQKRFIEKLKSKKHSKIIARLENLSKLTNASMDSLAVKVSKGNKELRKNSTK